MMLCRRGWNWYDKIKSCQIKPFFFLLVTYPPWKLSTQAIVGIGHQRTTAALIITTTCVKAEVSCVSMTDLVTQRHNRNSLQNLHSAQSMAGRRQIKMQASYLFAGGMHFLHCCMFSPSFNMSNYSTGWSHKQFVYKILHLQIQLALPKACELVSTLASLHYAWRLAVCINETWKHNAVLLCQTCRGIEIWNY